MYYKDNRLLSLIDYHSQKVNEYYGATILLTQKQICLTIGNNLKRWS